MSRYQKIQRHLASNGHLTLTTENQGKKYLFEADVRGFEIARDNPYIDLSVDGILDSATCGGGYNIETTITATVLGDLKLKITEDPVKAAVSRRVSQLKEEIRMLEEFSK